MPLPRIGQAIQGGFQQLVNGTPSPYLSPEEQAAASDQRRQAMIATLLQGSARTQRGTAPGALATFGGAIQNGNNAQSDAVQDAIRMRMLKAQMAQMTQGTEGPSNVRSMRELGYALTPEGFKQYNADQGPPGGESPTDVLLATLLAQQRSDQLDRDRRSDARTAEEDRVKKEQLGSTLLRGIDQTAELAELNTKLDGSFLQAGLPASSWRRAGASIVSGLGSAVGMDMRGVEQDIRNFDVLKKGLSDQLINLMSTGDLGAGTNAKLQQFQNALATTETSPGAIMEIQGKIAQTLLDEAAARGYTVPNRSQVEANIKKWHEYETKQGEAVVDAPAAAARVSEIARMSVAQLQELASKTGELTNEMREAAAKRWDELHAR
jgi:hypothetical protein